MVLKQYNFRITLTIKYSTFNKLQSILLLFIRLTYFNYYLKSSKPFHIHIKCIHIFTCSL